MNETHESFSLRDGEVVTLGREKPDSEVWFAVMAKSVPAMPGEMKQDREVAGLPVAPVELAAIIACQKRRHDEQFVWMQLSPITKEVIGDLMFASGVSLDQWYFASVSTPPLSR